MDKQKDRHVTFGDKEKQREAEALRVYCPRCGQKAKLIWSHSNDGLWPSWTCCYPECPSRVGWGSWFTTDPEPYREKPQRFKNLFDF